MEGGVVAVGRIGYVEGKGVYWDEVDGWMVGGYFLSKRERALKEHFVGESERGRG
jgi:hypothetical protein